jgi:hypothetical protein
MPTMRFTIVDGNGTISFPGPPHGLKALAAACSSGADDYKSLLSTLESLDASLAEFVMNGLAVFDEHVVKSDPDSIEEWFRKPEVAIDRPLRVVDEASRRASLEPNRLGVVIFNLVARRIVQIQNSYAELLRSDRGRVRVNGKPVNRYFHYSLPVEWQILP